MSMSYVLLIVTSNNFISKKDAVLAVHVSSILHIVLGKHSRRSQSAASLDLYFVFIKVSDKMQFHTCRLLQEAKC